MGLTAEVEAIRDEGADDEQKRDLIDAFQKWETTREWGRVERKRCNDNVGAKLAALKEAMEVGHSSDEQQLLKLGVVEQRWQDLEDARTERKDVNGSIKDSMKLAETRIRDLIAAIKSPQLGLFTSTSTVDNPPTPEDDDDEEDTDDLPD